MQLTDFFTQISQGVFPYVWWTAPVLLFSLYAKNSTASEWFGRTKNKKNLSDRLDGQQYRAFPNLQLPIGNGSGAADCVYVSKYGIFVVAMPKQGGFVSGSSRDNEWTADSHSRQTVFANPLKHNQLVISTLSRQLELPAHCFHSVAVFPDTCHFQTMMPDNVIEEADFESYIAQFDDEYLGEETLARITAQLESSEFDMVFNHPDQNDGYFHAA